MAKGIEKTKEKKSFKSDNRPTPIANKKREFKKSAYKKDDAGDKKGYRDNKSKDFNKDKNFNRNSKPSFGNGRGDNKRTFNKDKEDYSKDYSRNNSGRSNSYKNNKTNNYSNDGKIIEKRRREIDSVTLELRKLYNKLMLKNNSNKSPLVEKILSIIKDGFREYAFKHDGCRFFQGCIKYGDKDQRKRIISTLKELVIELATKKYGIFLALKMWKFGEKEQQDELLKLILPKLLLLNKSPSGEMFLNFVFLNSNTSIQEILVSNYLRHQMKVNFEDLKNIAKEQGLLKKINTAMEVDDDADNNILVSKKETFSVENFREAFKKTLEVILEKQLHRNFIFHASLCKIFDYLEADVKVYISEIFDDDFEAFLTSKPSVELALKLYTVASAKTRKKIMKKVFKEEWANSVLAFDFNYLIVTKVLLTTDDTKLSTKQIIKPLIAYSDQFGFNSLIRVIHGIINPSKINKLLEYNLDISSKKDLIKIQTEILANCEKTLVKIIKVNTEKFLVDNENKENKENILFLLDLIEFLTSDAFFNITNNSSSITEKKEDSESEDENVVKDKNAKPLLLEILNEVDEFIKFDYSNNENKLLFDKQGHFSIVQILKRLKSENIIKFKSYIPGIKSFFNSLINLIISNLKDFLNSKGVFIVLVLYENKEFGKELQKELSTKVKLLEQVKKENNLGEKSAISILIDQLTKK